MGYGDNMEKLKEKLKDLKIGLEVHVKLPTKTKLFCSCPNDDNEIENTNICPICLGFPGTRPKINRKAIELTISIAKALNCKLNETFYFSRKVYFYPDLPKGFQITQHETPIGYNGYLKISDGKSEKNIRIREVHLEEDAAKIKKAKRNMIIDFNRSGIPLAEIVTEPDITSLKQLELFFKELKNKLRNIGIKEMKIKADVNVSIFGERVEIKNIDSVETMRKAVIKEILREYELFKANKPITRATLHYDKEKDQIIVAREKETEEDYGYIPEPDLGIFTLDAFLT